MVAIAVSLIWVVAIALVWREVKPLVRRRLSVTEALAKLEVERVENERLALQRPPIVDADPMPQYMIDWAMNESFDWAREDKLVRMRELYSKLRDWDKVRSAMMHEDETAVKETWQ